MVLTIIKESCSVTQTIRKPSRIRNTMDKRNTKQKAAIREAFTKADRPLSPEEALQGAQRFHPTLGIATVYRNIQNLVEDGWLTPVELPGDSTRYEIAGKKHHHHFHCNSCGKLYELEGCVATAKQKLPRGFRATSHEFFLYGTCAACGPNRSQPHV
jgi:Fur family transcriptional regulator, ferric uptake regulator